MIIPNCSQPVLSFLKALVAAGRAAVEGHRSLEVVEAVARRLAVGEEVMSQ